MNDKQKYGLGALVGVLAVIATNVLPNLFGVQMPPVVGQIINYGGLILGAFGISINIGAKGTGQTG